MKWVKAIRTRHVCDYAQNRTPFTKVVEYRLRDDGAVYYNEIHGPVGDDKNARDILDDFMDMVFSQYVQEPLHSETITEQDFLEKVSRWSAAFKAEILFVKNEDELNADAGYLSTKNQESR